MKKMVSFWMLFVSLLFAQGEKAVHPEVVLHTNMGDITLEIRPDLAPLASENFLTHVKNGYYDGTIFHRVIEDFMIQGGDPTGTGMHGESIWGKPFKDEFAPNVVFDRRGILAMANAGPNTNGSQFFITTVRTPWLNGRHTIFGYVKKGMDVVIKISETGVDRQDRPLRPVKILKAEVIGQTPRR
ncbi:peptidylprolyl isomerase [Hydrogenimonas sp.]